MRVTIIVGILLLFQIIPQKLISQELNGIVIDSKTGEKLAYVHIGVPGKNIGVISNDIGEFQLGFFNIKEDESIIFSTIGYEDKSILKSNIKSNNLVVKLESKSYELNEVEVTARENKPIKLGRYKLTKNTTGQSGIDEFGFGGEWGIKITHTGENYYLEEINFHTKFNTVDSVLYRMNVYEVVNGIPGESKLQKAQFTKSYKKDKWISTNLLSHELYIKEDIIVTFELVRIWYSKEGENYLFYTHGKKYEEGMSFSKNSSLDEWKINSRGPIAMYIIGLVQE